MHYYILSQTRGYLTQILIRRNTIFNNFLSYSLYNPIYKQQHVYYSTDKLINVTFVFQNGSEKLVSVKNGTSILEAAHSNNIELEGACDGCLACSTCHVILEQTIYDKLPEPTEAELDMLDLAPCLTDTSRLGCQIKLDEQMEGIKIKLPHVTRNFYVDGHTPQPH